MKCSVTSRPGRLIAFALIAGSLLAAPLAPRAQAAPEQADLNGLAEHGQFNELLDQLNTEPKADQPLDAPVKSLISDLTRYEHNQAQRTEQKRADFDKTVTELEQYIQDDELEKALIAAVKAHGLAEDGDAFLHDPRVVKLVNQSVEAAEQAKQNDDWLEALTLYRALDLLYDQTNEYQDQVDQAARHIRVLQLYAPKHLKALYEQHLEKQGDNDKNTDEDQPDIEAEDWHSQLDGITPSMLRQTLRYAARKHVSQPDLTSLMQSSIDTLIVMLDTKGLDESFPAFADKDKLAQFRDYLALRSASLKEPGKTISLTDANTIISRIMETNEQTVNLPPEVITFELTQGLTNSLDDFSTVIWPEEVAGFSRNTQGNFSGIGVQISKRDGRLIVVSPLENTPAMKAGLKAGDVIAQVDGKSTGTWSLNRAVQEITGPRGTKVSLSIERPGEPEPLQYDITRDKIEIESIRGWAHKPGGGWDYWIDPVDRIGYVRLSQFIPQSAEDLDAAVKQMQADGPIKGLILDLRFNPGGLLSSAVDVADRFIIDGPIVSTIDGDKHHSAPHKASRWDTYPAFDMVVLVNQGSASASEIVSGALQDYHRATIIGTRSFGKGSVQDLFPLTLNGSAYLKLTTQYYMLPSNRIIHRKPHAKTWGIQPDLEVDMTTRQIADALKLRQEIDVIRDAGEPIIAEADMPWASDRFRVKDAKPYVDGKLPDGTDREVVEIKKPNPEMLLDLGLDAQLESALLVLKTRIATNQTRMANKANLAENISN